MQDRTKRLKGILDLVKKIRTKRTYIRVTEYDNFYFVATDDITDPMIFDKRGFFTGRPFHQISLKELSNPKEIYYEEE